MCSSSSKISKQKTFSFLVKVSILWPNSSLCNDQCLVYIKSKEFNKHCKCNQRNTDTMIKCDGNDHQISRYCLAII